MSADYNGQTPGACGVRNTDKNLTRHESKVLSILKQVADKHGMLARARVRVEDALLLYESGSNSQLYKFAFASRFDFLLSRDERVVMVVEFDGAGHPNQKRLQGERIKSQLCTVFKIPMLRADTQYLRVLGDSTILEYLVDETLRRLQNGTCEPFPSYTFEPTISSPKLANYCLSYDVKHISLSPQAFLKTIFKGDLQKDEEAAQLPNLEHFGDEKILCSTRLVKTKDNFYIAAAFTVLDDDTAILGTGAIYADPNSPLDGPFLAVALALIDTLDLLRMFDLERYSGLALKDAIEYLTHFQKYADDEGCGRFLNMSPLCESLTNDWLKSPVVVSHSVVPR
jgi:hypothetical protein